MRTGMEEREMSPLDDTLSRGLSSKFGNLSRRAFLSKLTRQIIGMTGVFVAAEFLPSIALADPGCGRHGWACGAINGNCQTTVPRATAHSSWVQCCEIAGCPTQWVRCTYTDYCRTIQGAPFAPFNCTGPNTGISWCNGDANTVEFICTEMSCQSPGFTDRSACQSGWTNSPLHNPCAVCIACPP